MDKDELEKRIASLPAGAVTKKHINGRDYYYHRWTEDKKRREKYIPEDEVENFKRLIEQRKALERELKGVEMYTAPTYEYETSIRTGQELCAFSSGVVKFKKREIFNQLSNYIFDETQEKVFILYGLRRTGKTTMIRQVLAQMDDDTKEKTAFIQIKAKDTLAGVNRDLRELERRGVRYVFLDEVTLMDDFIEGAALFSDVFAASGMKIVLSGTDSLGFLFTGDEQLYDRCIMVHTTFIPYREFSAVLGINGIDEYIRYGGTMSIGGRHYNEESTFASKESADEYVDTAIARNIQHSLDRYQYGGHFRSLKELYDKNELTSAINRVVEDVNHQFTLEVLTREFKSHDLGISAGNLRRDRENPTDILDRIDIVSVTERLRKLMEIRNQSEMKAEVGDEAAAEIREYLHLLDMIQDIEVRYLPDINKSSVRTVIAQPGLRYAQAKSLIESLLLDEVFGLLSLPERTAVSDRIMSEIKGRMLEDIVLLQTKLANPGKQVFTLQFAIGEFDMVVFDPGTGSCKIFEIKHSREAVSQQYRHLIDEKKCAMTEHRYGNITEKIVLYRGKNQIIEGIRYLNVEEYLEGIYEKERDRQGIL